MGDRPAYWAATWVITVHWEHVSRRATTQQTAGAQSQQDKKERKKKGRDKNQTTDPKVGGIERRLSAWLYHAIRVVSRAQG